MRSVQAIKTMGLILALIASAGAVCAALETPAVSWLAWVALLPLFLAIRLLRPLKAATAGAFWGGCLYLFAIFGLAPEVRPSLGTVTLITAIPAIYAGGGALLTRRVGFSPLILACGWILVELAFTPLGLRHGLLAGTQHGTLPLWIARFFGTACLAFLVACVNAAIVAVLARARLGACAAPPVTASAATGRCLPGWRWFDRRVLEFRQTYPRGPPWMRALPI